MIPQTMQHDYQYECCSAIGLYIVITHLIMYKINIHRIASTELYYVANIVRYNITKSITIPVLPLIF